LPALNAVTLNLSISISIGANSGWAEAAGKAVCIKPPTAAKKAIRLFFSASSSWKIIESAKNTPFLPLALFSGIGAIYHPICFWFIFGGYGGDLVQAILTLGMLNAIDRSIKKEKPTKLLDQG
jgi:hypothetical protein